MLSFFHIAGRHLYRVRKLLWLLAAVCLGTFAVGVFAMDGTASQPWLIGSVVALIWTMSAVSVAYGFSRPLPEAVKGQAFFARLKVKLTRIYLWLMAALVSLISLGVIILSVRALSLLIRL